jgi:hypothetical protein
MTELVHSLDDSTLEIDSHRVHRARRRRRLEAVPLGSVNMMHALLPSLFGSVHHSGLYQ